MRRLSGTLGGRDVVVHAPEPGTPREAVEHILEHVALHADDLLGLDVEGTALTDLGQWDPGFGLRLVQFGGEAEAVVLDVTDPVQRQAAVDTLTDAHLLFTSHTQMDVLSVAVVLGVDITARNVDTRALANEAHPEGRAGRDLKTLATQHGMPELAAADGVLQARFLELYRAAHPERGRRAVADTVLQEFGWTAIPSSDPDYLLYAGLDAIAVRRLAPLLVAATGDGPELIRNEVWLAGRANRVQLRGMLVDVDRLDEVEAEAAEVCGSARQAVFELTGGTNPKMVGSPKLLEWLAGHGVDWSRWVELGGPLTKTGNPSLADEAAALLRQYDLDGAGRQVVDELLRYKGHYNRLTRAQGVRSHLAPDGRIHPVLIPNGATTTSRMSSSGPNMQNFSADTRSILVPDPGYVLLSVDYDQVELRVVAALAREQKMIDVILAGGDLHQLTADELGIARPVAKMTNFLIVYGGGGKALHEQSGLPRAETDDIVRRFRDRYRSIDALAKYLGTEREAVYTITGRRLPVTTTKEGDARYWANINYMIQSSARDLLTDAWITLDRQGYGGHIWYAIHDELVLMAREDEAAEVMAAAERAMTFDFRGVPITASGIVLRQRDGRSTWMDGHEAEEIAREMGWAA